MYLYMYNLLWYFFLFQFKFFVFSFLLLKSCNTGIFRDFWIPVFLKINTVWHPWKDKIQACWRYIKKLPVYYESLRLNKFEKKCKFNLFCLHFDFYSKNHKSQIKGVIFRIPWNKFDIFEITCEFKSCGCQKKPIYRYLSLFLLIKKRKIIWIAIWKQVFAVRCKHNFVRYCKLNCYFSRHNKT